MIGLLYSSFNYPLYLGHFQWRLNFLFYWYENEVNYFVLLSKVLFLHSNSCPFLGVQNATLQNLCTAKISYLCTYFYANIKAESYPLKHMLIYVLALSCNSTWEKHFVLFFIIFFYQKIFLNEVVVHVGLIPNWTIII